MFKKKKKNLTILYMPSAETEIFIRRLKPENLNGVDHLDHCSYFPP